MWVSIGTAAKRVIVHANDNARKGAEAAQPVGGPAGGERASDLPAGEETPRGKLNWS